MKSTSLTSVLVNSIRNRKQLLQPITNAETSPVDDAPLIASYNVHKCVGRDGRFDPDRIAKVIQELNADIVALQEADSRFGERIGLLDLDRIERECGLSRVVLDDSTRAHGWHGNVLLFRDGSVADVHTVKLPGLEPRGALITELSLKNGSSLRVVAAHFGLLKHSRAKQVGTLIEHMNEREDVPTILLGDFNEWRLGKRSSLKKFDQIFKQIPAPVPSFPSNFPVLSLDRIIANHEGLIGDVVAHDTPLARMASDHLPIKTTINIPNILSDHGH